MEKGQGVEERITIRLNQTAFHLMTSGNASMWRTEPHWKDSQESGIRHSCEWEAERKASDDTPRSTWGKNEKMTQSTCGILKWHPRGACAKLWRGWRFIWQREREREREGKNIRSPCWTLVAPPFLNSSFNRRWLGLYRSTQARTPPAPCLGLTVHLKLRMYSSWARPYRREIHWYPFPLPRWRCPYSIIVSVY